MHASTHQTDRLAARARIHDAARARALALRQEAIDTFVRAVAHAVSAALRAARVRRRAGARAVRPPALEA